MDYYLLMDDKITSIFSYNLIINLVEQCFDVLSQILCERTKANSHAFETL